MRILIALLAIAACCFAEAPYPPSGTKPQGPVLILPTEYGSPRNPAEKPRGDNYDDLEDFNAKLMERLKQEQGSERGVYHVYLQDGRLQRVQYTTAPIRPVQQEFSSAQYNSYKQQQQREPSKYLASIQYSPVEPIQGPVYSYKPQPLTRILRYAPVFY